MLLIALASAAKSAAKRATPITLPTTEPAITPALVFELLGEAVGVLDVEEDEEVTGTGVEPDGREDVVVDVIEDDVLCEEVDVGGATDLVGFV